jgi:Secretion system C-terminal sorting domain
MKLYWFMLAYVVPMSALAQDSLAQYHPLQNGNTWIYHEITGDNSFYITKVVVGDSVIAGDDFQILRQTNSRDSSVWLTVARYDTSTSCYYVGGPGDDQLEDSTTTFTPGATFGKKPFNTTFLPNRVFEWIDTGIVLQMMTTTRHIAETVYAQEQETQWAYARGFGLVFQIETTEPGSMIQYSLSLVYAKIDGIEYGSIPLSVRDHAKDAPGVFQLYQNYPNPFNPTTIISYQLALSEHVKLELYDLLGRKVRTLVNEYQTAGTHSVNLKADNLSSGVYLHKLSARGLNVTKQLTLIK